MLGPFPARTNLYTHLLVEDAGKAVGVGDVFRIAKTELQMFAVLNRYAT